MGVPPNHDNNALTPTMVEALLRHKRTCRIVRKLYRHLDDITRTNKLRIVIDCAGDNVRLTRTLHDDN